MARSVVHGGLHTDGGLVAHASQAGLRQHRSSQADFDEMDVLEAAANEAEDALVHLQVRAKLFFCSHACSTVGFPPSPDASQSLRAGRASADARARAVSGTEDCFVALRRGFARTGGPGEPRLIFWLGLTLSSPHAQT